MLRRVRWGNVARLAGLPALLALVVLWPRLAGAPPVVPGGAPVPVAPGGADAGAAPGEEQPASGAGAGRAAGAGAGAGRRRGRGRRAVGGAGAAPRRSAAARP